MTYNNLPNPIILQIQSSSKPYLFYNFTYVSSCTLHAYLSIFCFVFNPQLKVGQFIYYLWIYHGFYLYLYIVPVELYCPTGLVFGTSQTLTIILEKNMIKFTRHNRKKQPTPAAGIYILSRQLTIYYAMPIHVPCSYFR